MTHHNINARATVILTAEGARIVNEERDQLARSTSGQVRLPHVEEGDTYERPLWMLFNTFGDYMNRIDAQPFANNSLTLEDS